MRAKRSVSFLAVLAVLAFVLAGSLNVYAQCYLSQGCQPVDNLTFQPNGTGQVYHGDGASNNGSGGWTTNYSDVDQCLSCHYGADTAPYLMSGHKNTLRKIAPGSLWGDPTGAIYSTTDNHYGSGSTYNWTNGTVTLGWCDPISVLAQNGFGPLDPACQYPDYTLANSHAPASYAPVAPTAAAGGVQNLLYLFGGWQNFYAGTSTPATHLGSIFNGGSTGDLYPNGNFDCARCHTTGYNFDASAPEPTANTNGKVAAIPNAQFSRIPTDGYVAPGTNGTSSWFLTGVQCERCHVAGWSYGSHPWYPLQPTQPQNEAATALCMECHRGETITPANPNAIPPVPGNIAPAASLTTRDYGYCSDLSGSAYSTCVTNPANTWIYKPYFDHEAGQAFLNSPHARFSGTLTQNAQHSSNLSITIAGTYQNPYFSETSTDQTKNSGCTGCHDPHQSTVAEVNAPNPIVKKCSDCHRLAQNIVNTINHPLLPGTAFQTGAPDVDTACMVCHMQGALGTAQSHLFRINPDPNYYTFPTAAQLYTQNITAPNTAPETSALTGVTYSPAVSLDVDLACGQCHVGNDGKTNTYGLAFPPGMPGAHAYTRTQLAYWASVMHPPDPSVPTPTFSPLPTSYTTVQSVTISDSMSGAKIYYTSDGSLPTTNSPVYSAPITVSTTTRITAMATYPDYPASAYALGVFTILLPTAPAPTFYPSPWTYSTPQSVTISEASGLPIYYTIDGSTPTANSTLYTGPITISKDTTLSAISVAAGYLNSGVTSGVYSITAPIPAFSPQSGTFYTAQNVTISDTTSGTTIYYTTDLSAPTTSSTSCSNPCSITVPSTTTIKAIASGGGYVSSNVSVATYTIAAQAPTFSPASGATFYAPTSVTISDTTVGAIIYYAMNGFPTTSSPSCSSPCTITIPTTSVVRAMAAGNGISQSSTSVGSYTVQAQAPTFSPASGTYVGTTSVTMSDVTSGVTIYYTTNGSIPSTSSASCSSPCTLSFPITTTLRAMAASSTYSQSNFAYAVYTIDPPPPTFSQPPGTYTGAQSVTVSDATSAASIYYTTNGTYPSVFNGTVCSNPCPLTVSSTTTIYAMASGSAYGSSTITGGTYTIH